MEYTRERLEAEAASIFRIAGVTHSFEVARERLFLRAARYQFDFYSGDIEPTVHNIVRVRDCARVFRSILTPKSDRLSGFSVARALFDLARGRSRADLQPGFYAEMIYLIMGMRGRAPGASPSDYSAAETDIPREEARMRSRELDKIWEHARKRMARYAHGLQPDIIERRRRNRRRIMDVLGASDSDWTDWRWQFRNVVKDLKTLSKLVPLTGEEKENIANANEAGLPFGVTPHYLSLMDNKKRSGDTAIRAQVFPPANYVEVMTAHRHDKECTFDFMLENRTSPVDLITRRYPGIAIFKPFNTCPQICVYCQRNWEIDSAMAPHAMASSAKIEEALDWIADHPAIHELLITGGDPLALNDRTIHALLERVSKIKSIRHIRIGSRTFVTVPMRISGDLINIFREFIKPGHRDISLVTHVEHPYEITPDTAAAVAACRAVGVSVYNQQVFTFYNSRRFESALLRQILRQIGIDPYYTFNCKGKHETADYIVPIARLLQEVNEEARLLPGLTRTDEPVYNVPGLGKNYLRSSRHHEVISILPDGSRVYEFHPWEPRAAGLKNYVGIDVPVLTYLQRLKKIGEDISEYETIWYYY